MIKRAFPDATVLVDGEDCSFSAIVISPVFEGMGLLQRQKAILATVRELIVNGVLHAMTVNAYTPQQWKESQTPAPNGLAVL